MATTDEEVAKKKESVKALREKIRAARTKNATAVSSTSNDVALARLSQEEERLQVELDSISKITKSDQKSIIEDALSGPVESAQPNDQPSEAASEKE